MHFRVDSCVVEQIEVMQAGKRQPMGRLERNLSGLAHTRRALGAYQVVAKNNSDRPRSRAGRHEVVDGAGKERHLMAAVPQELVRVSFAPVLIEQCAVPQILRA